MSSVDGDDTGRSPPAFDLDERRRKNLAAALAAVNSYAEITGARLFVENNRVRAELSGEILGG